MSTSQNDPSQQNPLDALEELLNKTKQDSQGGAAVASGPSSDAAQPVEDTAARNQAQAEYEELAAQSQRDDDEKIAEQRLALEQVKQMPEYKARVQQNNEQQQAKTEEQEQQDGYAINQLERKKI